MKEKIVIVAIIVIIILFIGTTEPPGPKEFANDRIVSNYSNLFFNYRIIRYPTSVEIISPSNENTNIGFVTDPWNIKFGVVPGNGSYVKRYVGITNLKEKYNKVKLKAYGNITPLVNFSKNDFTLNENENTAVEVNLYTESADYGNYTGEIDIIIKMPKYDILNVIL